MWISGLGARAPFDLVNNAQLLFGGRSRCVEIREVRGQVVLLPELPTSTEVKDMHGESQFPGNELTDSHSVEVRRVRCRAVLLRELRATREGFVDDQLVRIHLNEMKGAHPTTRPEPVLMLTYELNPTLGSK